MAHPALSISSIMEKKLFFHEYQPLWRMETTEVFAYEALLRTVHGLNPVLIFQCGRDQGSLYEYDTASITNAIKSYPRSFYDKYLLFINIFPSTLVNPGFLEYVKPLMRDYPFMKRKVVFEINEEPLEARLWDEDGFKERVGLLKGMGLLIAFDDWRPATFSPDKVQTHNPDFIKLDRSCASNLSRSTRKQKAIRSLLAHSWDSIIVLEGIEKEEDFTTASRLGIHAVQGYYIAKPHRL